MKSATVHPLISIVIPVYNRADMIARTVRSCLAQTYDHIEIILVNDGSTDGLSEALRPFADNGKFRRIDHDQNKGVSAARNSGVQAAKGKLIAFLDSDDLWKPGKLAYQMALIDTHEGEDFICGTLTEVHSSQGTVRIRPKYRKPRGVPIGDYLFVHKVQARLPEIAHQGATLMGGVFAQTSAYLLPRNLALETPFRTALNQYEDMAFLIDLDRHGVNFLLVEEPLTIQHDDDRPGRLGARDDLGRGYQFLDAIGDGLSPDARLAFEATHLAHLYGLTHPVKVMSLVFRAFSRGLITPRSVVGILTRSVIGQAGLRALRNAARGRWWRPNNWSAI